MAMLKIEFVDPPTTPEDLKEWTWSDYEDGPPSMFDDLTQTLLSGLRHKAITTLNTEAHRRGGAVWGQIAFAHRRIDAETTRYFVLARFKPEQKEDIVFTVTGCEV